MRRTMVLEMLIVVIRHLAVAGCTGTSTRRKRVAEPSVPPTSGRRTQSDALGVQAQRPTEQVRQGGI
jgi:hypothetical protein